MRLALLQDHLRSGGTERQTIAIAQALAARDHQVDLVVFRSGGGLEKTLAPERAFRLHQLRQGPLKTDWFAPGLRRKLARLRPDIVLPMGRMANCHAGLLSRDPRRPYRLVATLRTGRSLPWLYRRALRHADHIVANSREALQRIVTQNRIHRPDTSTVIYNGCLREFPTPESNAQNPRPNKLHLLSVSMFRPQKRQIRLLRICAKLPVDIDWSLTLAGDGPTLASCRKEAAALGIESRVHFPGLLADPRPLYAEGDIAVHTSEKESLPNFLVEAQMAGLPVVAYQAGGVDETFRNESSGYLVRQGNESTFLDRLVKLAQSPSLRLQMSQAARDHARRNFTLQAQTNAYENLFNRLIATNSHA